MSRIIPGATYVELPGADTVYWVGDTTPMLDEIEEFITGVRGVPAQSGSWLRCCSPTSLARRIK